jgi:MipA family protein
LGNLIAKLILVGMATEGLANHEAPSEIPLWEFGIGIGSLYLPDYHGSDEYRGYVLPIPYVVYRGDSLQIDDSGVTGKILRSDLVRIDFSAGAGIPVSGESSKARRNMTGLDPTIEFGPLITLMLVSQKKLNFTFNLALREVLSFSVRDTINRGRVFAPYFKLDLLAETSWDRFDVFYLILSSTFGSRRYHAYYYDVDARFATIDRAVFKARSGYQGTRFTVTYKRRFDKSWWGSFVQYESLEGAVFQESPLVKSKHYFAIGLATSRVLVP